MKNVAMVMSQGCRSFFAGLALLLVGGALVSGANAQAVADMYAVAVPVAEQSNTELRRAAGLGLREVLVRVSGQSDAVHAPAVAGALGDAQRYLTQYRFERNPSTEPAALPWLAQFRFGPGAIEQLLHDAGLPVWAGNRPILFVWLVQNEGGARHFVDERAPLAAVLREQAQRRGLTLRFPNDFSALTVDDAWQMDAAKLRASARGGELLLLGRIEQLPDGRSAGAWTLAPALPSVAAPPSTPPTVQSEGDNTAVYLAQSMDRIADILAQQYAGPATATSAGITLSVSGIESFNDYVALLAYLKQNGSIKAANPVQVSGDTVLLQLKLESSIEQLARQLALDNRLISAPDSAASPAGGTLIYRWQAARG